jgi:prophage DNA circulation protein
MADVRDWLASLWRASYKGVPFFFEQDDEDGGRGLVVHLFPNRDDPFIEDLGENPRHFGGTAYVHGDDADAQAAALIRALASRGPGTLVVPLFGPLSVRCLTFRRKHERDRLGIVAFELRFVREGAATALASVAAARNAAFGAADALSQVLADRFAPALTLDRQPDHVISAASGGVELAAAVFDALRTSYAVDVAASSAVRDALAEIVSGAATGIASGDAATIGALAAALVAGARALADGMPPASAARSMVEAADQFLPQPDKIYHAPSQARAAANAAAAARLARLAALTAFAEATIRRDYADRPAGVTARAELAARFQVELEACRGAADAELYLALQDLRAGAVDYLSRLINDLSPVVTVTTLQALPSLAVAWRLYADPLRARELAARNQVRHPSFMPLEFSALAA